MDFLRLHLPGLHQALRGALDSFSTFVSYLIGDEVPTVEREPQAAEELGEVAAGKPGNAVEEEAQEALEGLRSGQSKKVGGPEAVRRCQERSLAGEQTCGWRTDSSLRSQADRQDTGTGKAAEGGGGQEPDALLGATMRSESGPGTHRDRSSRTQEICECGDQEMSKGEPPRTWEQEEEEKEEEDVRETEPEIASGVESQPTWHWQLEGKVGVDGQTVTQDSKETEWMTKEAAAETKGPVTKGADSEEERMVLVRDDQRAGAPETQGPSAESKDWAVWNREEIWTALGREKADILGIQETEYWPGTEESIPETTRRVWVLEEVCRGDQEEEVDEKREGEERLYTQLLESERTKEATEGQTAWRESVGDQETEEDKGRQDSDIRANAVSLEEAMQAEKAPRENGGCQATEASLALDTEAEGNLDLAASPGARPEESFTGMRSEEAQTRQKEWSVKVTEEQKPELMGGAQTSAKQPEDGQEGREETERVPGLSREELLRSLEEHPSPTEPTGPELETRGGWQRDVDSRNTHEVQADAEVREEETMAGQAMQVQAKGGQESQLPEVPGWETEEALVSRAMNQELGGSQGPETGTSQSQGGSEATENKASEGETAVSWEAADTCRGGRRPEEVALSLQDSENMQTISWAAETILSVRSAGAGEGPEWEAGVAWKREFGMDLHSKGREDVVGGTEQEEAAEDKSEQEIGLQGSAEKVTGHSVQETGKIRKEQGEVGTPVKAEGVSGLNGVNSGSQAERTESSRDTAETEGLFGEQVLLEEEGGQGQEREWRDHHPEEKAQKLHDVEDIVSEGQRPEIQETDPDDLGNTPGQEGRETHQVPAVAVSEPPESAEVAANAPGHVHNNWSEALLPGSRLDVSVPRSRVLLSRSSSQRRSRPSFRRTPAPEQQQHDPPSLQPQEELSALPQPSLQSEETSEPSPTKPEETPVPTKKKPLGHGFGLAHSGMMQELQARLNRPKPQ